MTISINYELEIIKADILAGRNNSVLDFLESELKSFLGDGAIGSFEEAKAVLNSDKNVKDKVTEIFSIYGQAALVARIKGTF